MSDTSLLPALTVAALRARGEDGAEQRGRVAARHARRIDRPLHAAEQADRGSGKERDTVIG